MSIKIYKSFLFIIVFLLIFTSTRSAKAEEILPAEVYPSPSDIEAGKNDVIVYLLGLNSQLFSHSSSKEPIVEADTGVTIKDFRVLSPKRAQMIINTSSDTVGAIKHNLKFYDPKGVEVVKTCVFYVNILGKATVSDLDIKMYSIPEVFLGYETIQRTGSFEVEGVFSGRITLTLPSDMLFKPGVPPQITSLSVNSSVYNIEVDETGDDIEFVVNNPQEEKIKLFFTDLYIDTSGAAGSSVKGSINLTIHSDSFTTSVAVPVAHTPGYSVSSDEDLSTNTGTSSNNSSRSTSGTGYSYNGTSSSSSSSSSESSNNDQNNDRVVREMVSTYSSGFTGSRYNGSSHSSNYRSHQNYPSNVNGRYDSKQRIQGAQSKNIVKKPPRNNNPKTVTEKIEEIENKIEVKPTKNSNFEVLRISLCNSNFNRKSAIPLKVTDSGFEASVNFEILIDSQKEMPDEIEVTILIGENFSKNIKLKKHNFGIYRSSEEQKFSITYEEISSE